MRTARSVAAVCVAGVVALAGLVLAQPAAAAARTRYVAVGADDSLANTCLDADNPCDTIQHAVDESAAGDTVSIGAGSYDQLVYITKSLTMRGTGRVLIAPGPPALVLTQDIVTVRGVTDPITVTLDHLVLTGNYQGTGLVTRNATTVISDSEISVNGQGVLVNRGSFTMTNSTLEANGNGLDALATPGSPPTRVAIDHTTVSDNRYFGLSSRPNTVLKVANSTFDGNLDAAISTNRGSTTVTDSTIAATSPNNTFNPGRMPLRGSVVYDDRKTSQQPETVQPGFTMSRTILGRQARSIPDCKGPITDGGYNLSSDSRNSCKFTAGMHDLVKTDAKLGKLGDHGGPTPTRVPARTSPAIDAIPAKACPADDDQRGTARPQGEKCDIGAVEVAQTALVVTTANSLPHGTVGEKYRARFAASGGLGGPYAYSLAGTSRPLPAGLTLSRSGLLTGTPTETGTYRFTISVDDPTLKTFTLRIEAASGAAGSNAAGNGATPVAATGASPMPLTALGLLLLAVGAAVLVAAGRAGVRPGRHRSSPIR